MLETSSMGKTRAEVWRGRLYSALRTTLACSIVGCTSLYGPAPLRRYLEFPSFTYATTVLIVSDATLGDVLRGCWRVFCSNIQVMVLSLVSLRLIGPRNFSNEVAALAMAASAFLVALPESTHLVTKQLAFGQLVNVYVSTVVDGGQSGLLMHPLHVICSTAFGALASLIAILLPYPRLAYYQARKFYGLYAENACERFNCNIEAISAPDKSTAVGFFTQAKYLCTTGAKLLQSIRSTLDGIHWERPQTRIFKPHWIDPEEKLQDLELPMRAMDIALSTCTSFPVGVIDEELRGVLLDCRGQFSKKLGQQAKCFAPFDATITSEMKKDILTKNLSIAYKDLPSSFFLYCVHLLLGDSSIEKKNDHVLGKTQKSGDDSQWSTRKTREVVMNLIPSNHNLAFALKSSLSLGLAVFFGLTYNKENGYWAGLLISLCFVTGRHPTFSLANARGQGTAMGSIYGILCCFIFQKNVDFIFLPLLPWVVFSSFLRYSRMYGQAGGISAVTGALLVVGMKHHDPPSQFALARIVEATIGLLCFVIVEILFNPCRAATLAKSKLSQCLRSLKDCMDQIAIIPPTKKMSFSSCQALRETQKKLKSVVGQLEEFTAEAELEPNFWFVPFHNACYGKMLKSLSRMTDLLLFVAYSMENVMLLAQKNEVFWVDLHGQVNENVRIFKNKVSPTLKCLEEITRIKSPRKLEDELKNRNLPCDIETQEYANADAYRVWSGDEEVDSITGSFLKHLEEITNKIHTDIDEEMLKSQILFHYSCLGFCTSSLVRETIKIQCEVKELLMWENPSSQTNFEEIYCKDQVRCSQ